MTNQRILYISGSIGMGHVTRDLAIVRELRARRKDVEIVWLAEEPAISYLREKGEVVLSDLERLPEGATDISDAMAKDYTLNLYPLYMEWYKHFPERAKLINDVAEREKVDLIVGDETYDLFSEYTKHPKLRKKPFLLILDFVGGHLHDGYYKKSFLLYMYNKWNRDYIHRSYGKEGTVFIGTADDVVDESLGFMLPSRRDVVRDKATCVGYILNFDPSTIPPKEEVRREFGFGPEPLVVVTVGGTAVGAPLLRKAADAYPLMKRERPDLKMILVGGPRVPTDYVKENDGLKVVGLVPDLYRLMSAADLVVTSGGGTTTLELQAMNKPFLYFPLEQHFEQQTDVCYHLMRDNIGVRMGYNQTTPELLAKEALANLGKEVSYPKLPLQGERLTAEHIVSILDRIAKGELKVGK